MSQSLSSPAPHSRQGQLQQLGEDLGKMSFEYTQELTLHCFSEQYFPISDCCYSEELFLMNWNLLWFLCIASNPVSVYPWGESQQISSIWREWQEDLSPLNTKLKDLFTWKASSETFKIRKCFVLFCFFPPKHFIVMKHREGERYLMACLWAQVPSSLYLSLLYLFSFLTCLFSPEKGYT